MNEGNQRQNQTKRVEEKVEKLPEIGYSSGDRNLQYKDEEREWSEKSFILPLKTIKGAYTFILSSHLPQLPRERQSFLPCQIESTRQGSQCLLFPPPASRQPDQQESLYLGYFPF
jgi:hypothetical protein